MKYCRNISNNLTTIEEIIKGDNPITLADIRIEAGFAIIKSLMLKFIQGMLLYYGYDPEREVTVSDYQVELLADDICDKYHYFSLQDVAMCFKKARVNPKKYGRFYGRFDASVVMEWFLMYNDERNITKESIQNVRKPVYTGEECSRSEYYEILQAKIAGGDMYANEEYQNAIRTDGLIRKFKSA